MAQYKKVNVTYHAPEGDSKVVEMGLFPGTSFFDGVAVDVICTLDQERTLENNKHFQINSSVDHDPGDVPQAKTKADPKITPATHKEAEHKR